MQIGVTYGASHTVLTFVILWWLLKHFKDIPTMNYCVIGPKENKDIFTSSSLLLSPDGDFSGKFMDDFWIIYPPVLYANLGNSFIYQMSLHSWLHTCSFRPRAKRKFYPYKQSFLPEIIQNYKMID